MPARLRRVEAIPRRQGPSRLQRLWLRYAGRTKGGCLSTVNPIIQPAMSPTAAKLFRKAEILREFLPLSADAIACQAYALMLSPIPS